jgi:RimJ/RimL family protein N-acetyltransferase
MTANGDGMDRIGTDEVRIEAWDDSGLDLLRLINAPEMKLHLGGPETEEQVVTRHRRYLSLGPPGSGAMFGITLASEGRPVGSIGYWEKDWQGATVYETGWSVLTPYQGRGIAVAAGREIIARARAERRHRHLHAFPSIGNPGSNAVCRRLGFELLEECDFEFPPGQWMRCNNWRLDLA